MRMVGGLAVAAGGALVLSACASVPEMTPTRAVSKGDNAACTQAASKVVDDPSRRNNQTAAAVGTTLGAGLVGLLVVSAAQSHDDEVVSTKARNDCLARRGYKLVPAKPKE